MQAAIGTLFVGAFANILPYVNAIVMVIKYLARTIASFFGIAMKDYNTGLATYADDLAEYSEGLDSVGGSADGASNSIKALKKQVLGFDQINNLVTPTPTSGSGGGGGAGFGGIDEKLLAALEEYDNGMFDVTMKANEIRDKIMEWLGFTKEINEETQETSFNYDTTNKTITTIAKEIATNLGNMLNYYTNAIDWSQLGEYLAIGLNTAFGFLDTFVQTYDWKNLGTQIANFINKAIEDTDFETIGRVLTDKLRIAILTISGFVEKFDFKEFATKLADLINSAVENIPIEELTSGLNNLINGLIDTLGELLIKIDWGNIISSVVDVLSGLEWNTYIALIAPIVADAIFKLFTSPIITTTITKAFSKGLKDGLIKVNPSALGPLGLATGILGVHAETAIDSAKLSKKLFSGEKLDIKKPKNIFDWLNLGLEGASVLGTGGATFSLGFGLEELKSIKDNGIIGTLENINKSIDETFGVNVKDLINENLIAPFIDFGTQVGTVILDVYDSIVQTFDNIKITVEETWSTVSTWFNENVVIPIQDYFAPLIDWFNEIWGSITKSAEDLWNNVVGFVEGCVETIQILWGVATKWFDEQVITPVATFFEELWNTVKDLAKDAWEGIVNIWNVVSGWFNEHIINPVTTAFNTAWNNLKTGASKAWEGIKNVFSPVVEWFKDKFKTAWEGVKNVFSTGGRIFTGIKEGIEATFKTVVNGIIRGINTIIRKPFNTINDVIGIIKNIDIFGIGKPFQNKLYYISVPQIPEFANGGFPEDGFFRANHNELVGKFSNGRNVVANNQQIIKGIEQGVYKAVTDAMNNNNMGAVEIVAHTDEGVVIDRINRITRQTGSCPIEI